MQCKFAMQTLCKRYTNAMQTLCKRYANAMQTLYKRCTDAMQTEIYSKYPISNFFELIRGKDKNKDKIDP